MTDTYPQDLEALRDDELSEAEFDERYFSEAPDTHDHRSWAASLWQTCLEPRACHVHGWLADGQTACLHCNRESWAPVYAAARGDAR